MIRIHYEPDRVQVFVLHRGPGDLLGISGSSRNLLSLLGGLLAAITGFYFVTRRNQQAPDAAMEIAKASVAAKPSSLAPTDVKATLKGKDVIVEWKKPVSASGVDITRFKIDVSPGAAVIPPAPNTDTHTSVSGLGPGTYTFTVTATYSGSISATSAPI